MKKKIVSLFLVCSVFLGGTANSFAANSNDNKAAIGPSGDAMTDAPITIEEQEQALLKNTTFSEEKKVKFQKKFEIHKELLEKSKKRDSVTALTNDPSGTISVPYFKQEKNYWCGPATTKQTIHFINGSSSTQTTIATAIGTTTNGSNLADMVTYLNSKQSSNNYIIVNDPSETLIQGIAEYAVRNSAPAIGRLKIDKGGNWAYSSNGHYMNISGFDNYGSNIRVTDPYIGWVIPSSTGSYYVTSNEFYTATNNHFADQISY